MLPNTPVHITSQWGSSQQLSEGAYQLKTQSTLLVTSRPQAPVLSRHMNAEFTAVRREMLPLVQTGT